jgi:hypothetical protein
MSKAAQGFSPEAYLQYVEGGSPRRTPLIGKIAIYGWQLIKSYPVSQVNRHFKLCVFYGHIFNVLRDIPLLITGVFIYDIIF